MYIYFNIIFTIILYFLSIEYLTKLFFDRKKYYSQGIILLLSYKKINDCLWSNQTNKLRKKK